MKLEKVKSEGGRFSESFKQTLLRSLAAVTLRI